MSTHFHSCQQYFHHFCLVAIGIHVLFLRECYRNVMLKAGVTVWIRMLARLHGHVWEIRTCAFQDCRENMNFPEATLY